MTHEDPAGGGHDPNTSATGAWLRGRLQTDADCERALDGSASAAGGAARELPVW